MRKKKQSKTTFPKVFSRWQVKFLQRNLAKFKKSESMSNVQLAADIEIYTASKISAETIRRFIRRLTVPISKGEQETISSENLSAIIAYLTHEEIGIISGKALVDRKAPSGAPIGFINSLAYDLDDIAPKLHKSYDGKYLSAIRINGTEYKAHLTINTANELDFFNVQFELNPSNVPSIAKPKISVNRTQIRFLGWGVMTPENSIFLHLKEVFHGQNSLWISLASPLDFADERTSDVLVLCRHQIPRNIDPEECEFVTDNPQRMNNIKNKSSQHNHKNIVIFQSVNKFLYPIRTTNATIEIDRTSNKGTRSTTVTSSSSKKLRLMQTQNVLPGETLTTIEVDMKELGRSLIKAAQNYQHDEVRKLLELGAPVNFVDPESGASALIYAATCGDRNTIKVLIQHPDTSYLIKDKSGRTAADLALLAAEDTAVARLLHMKEMGQIAVESEGTTRDEPLGPNLDI